MINKPSNTTSKILATALLVTAAASSQQVLAETNRLCAPGNSSDCYLTGNFPTELAADAGLTADDDAALTIRFIDGEWSMGGHVIGSFGGKNWTPVVGDWDGNGVDNIGVYQNGMWILKKSWNFLNPVDDIIRVIYGDPSWSPIVGNWSEDDGKTKDGIGLYKDGTFRIRLNPGDQTSEQTITFNIDPAIDPGSEPMPISGTFQGYGTIEQVGIVRGLTAKIAQDNTSATYDFESSHPLVTEGAIPPTHRADQFPIVVYDNQIWFAESPPGGPAPSRCAPTATYACEWLDANPNGIGAPNDGNSTEIPTPQPF